MALVHDPGELDDYRTVLLEFGLWTGYILWRDLPRRWLDRELPGCTQKAVNELMIEHVRLGGRVHQVRETRPEYAEYHFHYDIRLPMTGRRLYIETVFVRERDLEDSVIYVVNLHDA